MDEAPPVVFVTGSDHFRRRRFLRGFVREMRETRTVQHVKGSDKGALIAALSEPDFTGRPVLVVVDQANKVDLALVEDHHKGKDNSAVLALHYEGTPRGNTKFGKLVKKLSGVHRGFTAPTTWDADEDAVNFCVEEAKRLGKPLTVDLAQALVSVIGSDLGLLSFEILKAVRLAEARGEPGITTAHVKAVKADIAEAQVFPVVRALEARNVKRLIRTLTMVKARSKTDPTIWVCRVVGPNAQKWLTAANLDAKGVHPDTAADQLGMKPWYYKNKVLPFAQRWKQAGAIRLIRAVAESERAVFDGHVAPWTGLVARLVKVCGSS
jgi:DNA polymerase III delta subunit